MKKLFIIAMLLVTSPAFAQKVDPAPKGQVEVKIEAPSKVSVGDLIVVDVSKSIGGGFDFIILPTPENILRDSNGKRIAFGTGSKIKSYQVIVSCAKADQSDVKTKTIKVRGVGGILSEKLEDVIIELASECKSPDAKEDALKLSQSFSTIALDVDIKDVPTLLSKTRTSNKDALNGNMGYWTEVKSNISAYLKAMVEAKKLNPTDLDAHKAIWKRVAAALADFAKR